MKSRQITAWETNVRCVFFSHPFPDNINFSRLMNELKLYMMKKECQKFCGTHNSFWLPFFNSKLHTYERKDWTTEQEEGTKKKEKKNLQIGLIKNRKLFSTMDMRDVSMHTQWHLPTFRVLDLVVHKRRNCYTYAKTQYARTQHSSHAHRQSERANYTYRPSRHTRSGSLSRTYLR